MGGSQFALSSCLWLERPAPWRPVVVSLVFALASVPAWPLAVQALTAPGASPLGSSFVVAATSSLLVAALVGAVAFGIGWPSGTIVGLYDFPLRRPLLGLLALPLLVPSFLLAIGWSTLAVRIGAGRIGLLSGVTGCVLVQASSAVPLVILAALVATQSITASQTQAARLAGGDRAVVGYACGHTKAAAVVAAALAAILTLSDPGPGQILGLRTLAGEILTSFAAQFDFALAGRQCLVLTSIVLLLTLPMAVIVGRRLATQMLPRQVARRHLQPAGNWRAAMLCALAAVAGVSILTPAAGLVAPAFEHHQFSWAIGEVLRTGTSTVVYAVGAGVIATILGTLVALAVGRGRILTALAIGCSLTVVALPPALFALGSLRLAAAAPAWLDAVFRSRAIVCIDLGFRFLPVAAVLAMRALQAMPVSWTLAAAVHGVSWPRYLGRVVLPHLAPAAAVSTLLVALLATADVGTVLLLQPPGEASLPLAIFTVMANAPQSLVASLCLVYLVLAGAALTGLSLLAKRYHP